MSDNYLPKTVRRQVYSKLMAREDQKLLDQARHVKQGEVEHLLSELNNLYYEKGSLSRNRLMNKLFDNKLDDHQNLCPYFICRQTEHGTS